MREVGDHGPRQCNVRSLTNWHTFLASHIGCEFFYNLVGKLLEYIAELDPTYTLLCNDETMMLYINYCISNMIGLWVGPSMTRRYGPGCAAELSPRRTLLAQSRP